MHTIGEMDHLHSWCLEERKQVFKCVFIDFFFWPLGAAQQAVNITLTC